jgi:SMI1-KNR4 cell-wall
MQNKYDSVMDRIKIYYVHKDQHAPPSEDDIRRFEKQIDSPLPADYRTFLAKYGLSAGGGITRFQNLNDPTQEESSVGVFYGLRPGDTYDLMDNWHMFKDDLPSGLLPIASSPGGQIVLSLSGDDAGRVFWWSQHRGSPDPYDDLELIAYDFDSFVNSLTTHET